MIAMLLIGCATQSKYSYCSNTTPHYNGWTIDIVSDQP